MLKITIDVEQNFENVIFVRNNRPVKKSRLNNFLNGLDCIPYDFEELFFKFVSDKKNRTFMCMLINEEQKTFDTAKRDYINKLKKNIVDNFWSINL